MTAAASAPSDLLQDAVAALDALIAFPTVSAESNLALIDWAEARLAEAGARTRRSASPDGRKANLFATIGPETDGGVALSGHTDVVPAEGQPWTSDPFRMRRAEGRLYGRGACDMKGFIACALAMAPGYAAAPLARPVHIALTYDEECGCLGAPVLLEDLARTGPKPAICLIGEPTEMQVIEAHKAIHECRARFTGLAGHGSRPELGVNAAEYAARFVAELMALKQALPARAPANSPYQPPWTTLNVGRIHAGTAVNVIPDHAEVEWEFRPVTDADAAWVIERYERVLREELLPEMRAVFPGAEAEAEVLGAVCGLERMEDNAATALAEALIRGSGRETSRGAVSFGTEAGLFQKAGMSAAVCGPGSIEQAHKADEYVAEAQLVACLEMLDGLTARLT